MPSHRDPFMLNTNLNWNGGGAIVHQLRGNSFGVDGRATGTYIAETTSAAIVERSNNPFDNFVNDATGGVQDRITIGTGNTLAAKSGLLHYAVGIHQYTIELADGTTLTQADFNNDHLPVRILNSSAGRKVLIDFDDFMLSKLNKLSPIAKIAFPKNATQNDTYDGYIARDFDGSYAPTCFTSGTLIETDQGLKPVEDLCSGDAARTLDDGYQEIRWVGSAKLDQSALMKNSKLLPIVIRAGALGPDLPRQDLIISRQHRILIKSRIAQRMFGAMEILVPAIHLVGIDGIENITDIENVTYWHILFDRHEVIFSNGTPTESLFLGKEAIKNVSEAALEEIKTLFPLEELLHAAPEPARPIPSKGAKIKQLISRHVKNKMSLSFR